MNTARTDLAETVLALLEQGKDQKIIARSVAAFLVDERRTKELNSLLRDLDELRYQKTDTLEAVATTAYPLSDAAKQKIRQLFEAKTVNIYEEIDPDVIGGVRVRALDKVADFSVQARLRRLRKGK